MNRGLADTSVCVEVCDRRLAALTAALRLDPVPIDDLHITRV